MSFSVNLEGRIRYSQTAPRHHQKNIPVEIIHWEQGPDPIYLQRCNTDLGATEVSSMNEYMNEW